MPSLTDSHNQITIYGPKDRSNLLGRILDCGQPSASRNAWIWSTSSTTLPRSCAFSA